MATDEELNKALEEIDFAVIHQDYKLNGRSWLEKLGQMIGLKKQRLHQISFLANVFKQSRSQASEERAYIMLGALQYSQTRWGDFPDHGPLYQLLLKQEDLNHLLSSETTDPDEVASNIFINPAAPKQISLKKFKLFMSKHKK